MNMLYCRRSLQSYTVIQSTTLHLDNQIHHVSPARVRGSLFQFSDLN